MNRLTLHLLLLVATTLGAGAQSDLASIPTNAPPLIELHDQFDAPQALSFPSTNIILLTIADKKGSDQIAGWITPIKRRFGTNINIRGIADVSKVPQALHGFVRIRFQKLLAYPVMMDWTGEVVRAFTFVPNKANVLVLDGRGRILQRINGEVSEKEVQDLYTVIDRALAIRNDRPLP